jgi:hypothetical protein
MRTWQIMIPIITRSERTTIPHAAKAEGAEGLTTSPFSCFCTQCCIMIFATLCALAVRGLIRCGPQEPIFTIVRMDGL